MITVVIVVTVGFGAACGGPAPTRTEEAPEQPSAATGERLVQERCTACHSLVRVEQAQKSQEGWEKTVSRMVDKGAEYQQEEQTSLVEYLAETYGP